MTTAAKKAIEEENFDFNHDDLKLFKNEFIDLNGEGSAYSSVN